MNTDFPRILTMLRKEQGISQKEAAGRLGISQALLSHYEKGIRECGLEFLVRACDFYQVSADYLLGRSPDRSGAAPLAEESAFPKEESALARRRRILAGSTGLLFSLLERCGNRTLWEETTLTLMLCVYRLLRILAGANPKNQPGLFALPETLAQEYARGLSQLCEARIGSVCKGERTEELENIADMDKLLLTAETIARDYPQYASPLQELIQTAEEKLSSCRRI